MARHRLNQYLLESKTDINYKSIDYLVMGNEAADLDSMASAIAYAYLMTARDNSKTIVPFMPILRADFKLRTEAVYVFGSDLFARPYLLRYELHQLATAPPEVD